MRETDLRKERNGAFAQTRHMRHRNENPEKPRSVKASDGLYRNS